MTNQKKRYLLWGIVYAILFLTVLLVANLSSVHSLFASVNYLLRPIVIGLVIAYLLNPFFNFFERRAFKNIPSQGLRRGLSLIFTYLTALLIFAVISAMIFPQLAESILDFADGYEVYLDSTVQQINGLIDKLNGLLPKQDGDPLLRTFEADAVRETIADLFQLDSVGKETIMNFLTSDNLLSIFDFASTLVSVVTDIIFGLFISFYLLSSKELRYAQIMRFRKAFFPDRVNSAVTRLCDTADRCFGRFLERRIVLSVIDGLILYLALVIFRIPYPLLIASVIALIGIIPVIGIIVGAFVSVGLILLADAPLTLPFLLIFAITTMLVKKFIAPRLIGEEKGGSTLFTLIVIAVFGAMWGVIGMLLSVPICAAILELFNSYLEKRLREKGLPGETESYYYDDAGKPDDARDGLIRQIRRRVTQSGINPENGGVGDLTDDEKLRLDTYDLVRKYHIFTDRSEEAFADFAAAESALHAPAEEISAEVTEETDAEPENTAAPDPETNNN